MHILIAPDSYKGSLTARQVCDILAQALLIPFILMKLS